MDHTPSGAQDHMQIRREQEPIRLFESDLLEFFTHIHPAVVAALWSPVIVFFFVLSIVRWTGSTFPFHIPIGFMAGVFVWTLAEYTLHRFVFHFRPRTPLQERISFLFHGVHHAQPRSKTRLVMPPAVSIPLAAIFYGAFYLLIGVLLGATLWVAPLFSGFVTGYLIYDMLHYATHHWRVRWAWFVFVRRYHLRHHTQTPDMRFGVSSPLWDIVFGTRPA